METGLVTFGDLTSFTEPIKAAGTQDANDFAVALLKARSAEQYLIFDGINIASNDEKVIAHIFRAAFFTANKIGLKASGNEPQMWEFEGAVLADPTRADSDSLGRYGFIRSHG
jgi:hypothetical protein